MMCDECATFAFDCRNIVCLYCDTHRCDETDCRKILLVNMTVQQLIEFFCGEDLSDMNWERMGQEYNAEEVRIVPEHVTELPFTNMFSFPQILKVRVYDVEDYSSVAKWLWTKIRLANRPAEDMEGYRSRIERMDVYDFICWYQHRYRSTYSTFEDRVFKKSLSTLRVLRSIYYGNDRNEVREVVDGIKKQLIG
jgi:hypothetical protein